MAETALITGASSGIGRELARVMAADGVNLVLVARRAEKLQELADALEGEYGIQARVLPEDLAQPDAPEALWAALQAAGVEIDILVNNAGFGGYGFFAATNWQHEAEMLQVNVVALTHLTKLFLPGAIARGRGSVLNVASTAAFIPGPLMAVYYATKAYVLSFSEAIANETRGTGVSVTVLCPGPTVSEFQERSQMNRARLLQQAQLMAAAPVAAAGYRALRRRQAIAVPGASNKFLTFSVRLLPRPLVRALVRYLQAAV